MIIWGALSKCLLGWCPPAAVPSAIVSFSDCVTRWSGDLAICGNVMCSRFERIWYLSLNPGEVERNVFQVANKSQSLFLLRLFSQSHYVSREHPGYEGGLKMESLKRHFPSFIPGVTTGPAEKLTVVVSQGAVEDEENFHLMLVPSSSFRWEPECARTCILLHFAAGYLMVLYPMKANLRE